MFKRLDDFENTISLTHNNHFGHFLIDNLPLLSLANGPMRSQMLNKDSLYSNNPRQVIKDLINRTCPSLQYKIRTDIEDASCQHISYTFKSQTNFEIISSNILCNAYLIEQRSRNKTNNLKTSNTWSRDKVKKAEHIFLVRGNKYTSRVSNITELTNYLKSIGFLVVDPTEKSLDEIKALLNSSKIVIAESGSTTLNALWFCSESCKIISLVSDELIFNTSTPMIHGGLPYVLPFLNRIKLFIGESKTYYETQSSNSCKYDCRKLGELLKSM